MNELNIEETDIESIEDVKFRLRAYENEGYTKESLDIKIKNMEEFYENLKNNS